jgi:glycosyltransferase involved in cell wall biosynthesis
MKIVHIIPNLKKGGAERMAIEICSQLSKIQSIQVVLVYLENLNHYENLTKEFDVKLIESQVIPSITSRNKVNVLALKKFIENFQPNIIHTHLFNAEIVSRFCLYPRAKWFTHMHDNMVQLENWRCKNIFSKSSITNFFEKILLFKLYKKNGGTRFIVISKNSEEYVKSIQNKYPITLLHNAIKYHRFEKKTNYNENSQINFREKYFLGQRKINDVQINIINVASFLKNKNQTFLLEIIREIKSKGINVNCVFLGDGPLLNDVKKQSILLGMEKNCHFYGNVEKVEEFMWNSDIYVHVALKEAFGLTLIEAMAAGLPVVTLDAGGNRDIMINGKNGYLIEKQDPKLFAHRIMEVYQNKKMIAFNSEFAKQFDIELYCEKLLQIYRY